MSHSIKIVFVHGWGMNSAVWEQCMDILPDSVHAVLIDLPGHGTMSGKDVDDFNALVNTVAATVTGPVIWVGWSLGGLVCLRLAEQFPEKTLGLCLVATNPCFVKKDDWQSAIDKSIFDDFSLSLKQDIDKTIKRFLALQVAGSETTMTTIKELRKALNSRGNASPTALDMGLDALSGIDFRGSLDYIEKPIQWVLGSRDTLVPVSLADELQSLSSRSEVVVIDGAAHAPFISHPEQFIDALMHFASGLMSEHEADD